MYLRLTLAFRASILAFNAALAQRVERYTAPRTLYGQPDFQGVWATAFLTLLERPEGVESLIAVTHSSAEWEASQTNDRRPTSG
jgi:hypothetical protein